MASRLLLLGLLLSLTSGASWAQAPVGGEVQVNSYTTDLQYDPAVASDANGNFVVVWAQDASSDGVFGKRFNAAGVPQGSEFRVNSWPPRPPPREASPKTPPPPRGRSMAPPWPRTRTGTSSQSGKATIR